MKYTRDEYQEALKVVKTFEDELKSESSKVIKNLEFDLKEYFDDNLLDGYMEIKEFSVKLYPYYNELSLNYELCIFDPSIDECYRGENDGDFELIGKKYNVNLEVDSSLYTK